MEVGRQEMLDNPNDLKLRLILLDLLHRACYRQHNMGNVLEARACTSDAAGGTAPWRRILEGTGGALLLMLKLFIRLFVIR